MTVKYLAMKYSFPDTLHHRFIVFTGRLRARVVLLTAALAAMCMLAPVAHALSPDTYAERSVLADGRWVRVSVTQDGPVRIPVATLRQWGFDDPARIRVFGYGGRRISDILDQDTYRDDLPQLQTIVTPQGVVFYAEGPQTVSISASGTMSAEVNPFSDKSYYYITQDGEGDDARFEARTPGTLPPLSDGVDVSRQPITAVRQLVRHELEQYSFEQSGHKLFGEDFRFTPSRVFEFNLPDRDESAPVQLLCGFAASTGAGGTLTLLANGAETDAKVRVSPSGANVAASYVTVSGSVDNLPSGRLALTVRFVPDGTIGETRLDAIDVTYLRRLAVPSRTAPMVFAAGGAQTETLSAAIGEGVPSLYDVTDPHNISAPDYTLEQDRLIWHTASGERRYAMWDATSLLPAPVYEGVVTNTNLHDALRPVPDMVIVARTEWLAQAQELAEMHRTDRQHPLDVMVVDAQAVYDEFSSGTPDVGALRRYFKMLYDRGIASGTPFRMALLMGRATYDNRGLTDEFKSLKELWLPTWNTDEALREGDSYTSDDIFAFLEDGSGRRLSADRYCIAVGRMPVGTVSQAADAVSKMRTYMANRDMTGWKNRVLLVADDGNLGTHMDQTEEMQAAMLATEGGSRMFYHKAYIDAFPLVGGSAQGARERIHRLLDEGVMLWSYIGHAGRNFLSGDNILTYTDINSLRHKRWPVFYGATCSFARWDGVEPSGCELMFANPRGGIIAAVSATREVLISENGLLSNAWGNEVFALDSLGHYPTLGEAYMAAKNRLASPYNRSNANKLKYVLLGDPALRPWPDTDLDITSMAGQTPGDEENPPVLMARQPLTVEGVVRGTDGQPLDDFDGVITASIHDAEYSTTSLGRRTTNDGNGKEVVFQEQGDKLYAGNDSIRGGRFTLRVAMPSEVADNYRPAAITLYARSQDGREAIGCNRQFYVYGYDDTAPDDRTAPRIEYAYLNHESFESGQAVNASPLLLARVSDDTGINLSSAGVGHRMTVRLDSIKTYNDVAQYFTPSSDGTPSGTLAYPLSDLEPGTHLLELRVWDTNGNSATEAISFEVRPGLAPTLFDVYTDANPAVTEANFYVRHDRPDADLTVTVQLCDLMGRTVWSKSVSDRSDMFVSAPLHWDLRDFSGRRVPRGIYLYRTTVSAEGSHPQTLTRRLAVAAE